MKVSRQRPFILLVKVGWRRGKTFYYEEGKDEIGAEKEVEQGSTALN
jgi:hypothetical protein